MGVAVGRTQRRADLRRREERSALPSGSGSGMGTGSRSGGSSNGDDGHRNLLLGHGRRDVRMWARRLRVEDGTAAAVDPVAPLANAAHLAEESAAGTGESVANVLGRHAVVGADVEEPALGLHVGVITCNNRRNIPLTSFFLELDRSSNNNIAS